MLNFQERWVEIGLHGSGSTLIVCTPSWSALLETPLLPSHPSKDERFNEKTLMSSQHRLSHIKWVNLMSLSRRMVYLLFHLKPVPRNLMIRFMCLSLRAILSTILGLMEFFCYLICLLRQFKVMLEKQYLFFYFPGQSV